MEGVLKEIYDGIVEGKNKLVAEKVKDALDSGLPAGTILNESLIAGMAEVGRLFEEGEYFVPEMLIAARAMQAGLGLLKPHLKESGVKARGRVAIGTVKGDLHDIGKNLVAMMLEGAGFEIVDLGTDVAPEKFAAAVREHHPSLVGMSALLTTTMKNMHSCIEAIEDLGLRSQVKILIGGAPVTEAFATSIGADGYAPDASRAVALAKSFG
jgi:5-methyltetrahydrofolate--homocysteine methyltransferase